MKVRQAVPQASLPADDDGARVTRARRFYEHDYAPMPPGRNPEMKRRPGWSEEQRKAAERQRRMWQEFFSASTQRAS
jgi:hypothetical protein